MEEEDAAGRRERLMSLRLQAQQASSNPSSSSSSPVSSSHSPSLPKFSNPFSDQSLLDPPYIPSQARNPGFHFYTDPVAAFRSSSKGRGGRGGAPWQQQQQQQPSPPFHATGSFVRPPPPVSTFGHSSRGPLPPPPPPPAPHPAALRAPPSYNHPPFRPSAPFAQGRGSRPSGGRGGGRSWPGSRQRTRPEMEEGNRVAKYPRSGEDQRVHGAVATARERPDLFYSKSMVEDPWKDLVRRQDNNTRQQGIL